MTITVQFLLATFRLLNQFLSLGIDMRSRFVHDENRRIVDGLGDTISVFAATHVDAGP